MAQRPNGQRGQSRQLTAALAYAARGWRVFPLHNLTRGGRCSCGKADCTNNTAKHPRTGQGFKDASDRAAVIQTWWQQWPIANIGIPTGGRNGLIVLDVDPRHDGLASLDTLQQRYGALPDTLSASTGGGGKHYFFAHPGGDVLLRSLNELDGLPGIDIKADGGYIVAAPSLHASGAYYAWDVDGPASPLSDSAGELSIAPAPEWLLALLSRPRGNAGTFASQTAHDRRPNDGSAASVDQDGRYWLSRALERAREGTRNETGFWLACQLRDAGLAEPVAEGVMAEYAASVPGADYSEREALSSLRQAYRMAPRDAAMPANARTGVHDSPSDDAAYAYTVGAREYVQHAHNEQSGQDTTGEASDDANPHGHRDQQSQQAKPPRFLFMTDTDVENLPPPQWLIRDYLPEGQLSVVFGAYASFKSFLVLDWALSIATGMPWLGRHTVEQGAVAYIAGEGIGGMGRRMRAWKQYHGWEGSANIHLLGGAPQLLQPGDVRDLIDALRALPEVPRLIIIDTLARSLVGGDENSAKDMGLAVAGAELIRTTMGCNVLLVHHSATGAKKPRGSNSLPGALNTLVMVERDERDRDRVLVRVDKQKEAAELPELYLRTHRMSLSDDPDDTSLVLTTAQGRRPDEGLPTSALALLQIIRNPDGQSMRTTDVQARWVAATGLSERSFFTQINTLLSARLIHKTGDFWMAN